MGYFLRQSSVNPKKDHAPRRKKKVRKTEDKKVYNISIARRREKSLNARCLGPFGDAKVGIKKAPRKWSANSLPILRNLCEFSANSLRGIPKFCAYLVNLALQKSLAESVNLS